MKIPEKAPNTNKLLENIKKENPDFLLNLFEAGEISDSNYRHWDKLKYLKLPKGVKNHQQWWLKLKLSRNQQYRKLPFMGIDKIPFKYILLDHFLETTHYLDQVATGNIQIEQPLLDPNLKDYYLINSIIEESVSSSQLEGATTTRDIAKKMIQEGREPRDKSERMILNNYEAISFIQENKNEELTPEFIHEIHRIISKETIDKENRVGEYRNKEDDIHILVDNDNVIFTPPHYHEIEKRISALCDFANSIDDKAFLHPVIKGIILHFTFSYIHPYVDGNGRTARALFYWLVLKKGYWLFEYISISRILKKSPAQYGKAYLYTETDENDLTYFIDYQLKVIKKAFEEFNSYLNKKKVDIANTVSKISQSSIFSNLNIRQITLLEKIINNPGTIISIQEYKNSHNVVYQTARTDLLELSDKFKVLEKVKRGRTFIFIAPSDILERLNKK